MNFLHRPVVRVLAGAWIVLLASPAVTGFYFAEGSDGAPAWSLAATATLLLSAWLLVPSRLFFACTYPLALLAAALVVADWHRNVDLLDLAAQWRTFSRAEINDFLLPYAVPFAGAAVVLAVVAVVLWRGFPPVRRPALGGRLLATTALAAVFLAVPAGDQVRAWPVNAMFVTAAALTDTPIPGATAATSMEASPRLQNASWGARLRGATGARATYVLVIGETVRADYLKECGGPKGIRPVRDGALVACDVTAGSNQTSDSVPLLISRELPGHGVRVSADGTFQHAFAETGFSTYWFGTQAESVAWPDAATRKFASGPDERLLPLLDEVLGRETGGASIVLHGMGAHSPYCDRFDPRTAPYPDACKQLGSLPAEGALREWRAMYANAVDASLDFVNTVIARLERVPGEVFLVYTPDHGENLLDDRRGLAFHALRKPTRWASQVPAIFWANDAWKAAHPEAWRMLQVNATQPLMHADLVPTLLSAAGIRYRDRRWMAVDLLVAPVPPRERLVQKSPNVAVRWNELLRDAQSPVPSWTAPD